MKEKAKLALKHVFETAVAIAIVGGIGYGVYSSYQSSNQKHADHMALDLVSLDAPASLSGLTLGDVYCAAAKEEGAYGVKFKRGVNNSIEITLADGSQARLNCHAYEVPGNLR